MNGKSVGFLKTQNGTGHKKKKKDFLEKKTTSAFRVFLSLFTFCIISKQIWAWHWSWLGYLKKGENQWRNSCGGGRGQSAPLKLFSEKFLLTYWEKRGWKKKGKIEKKSKKIVKEKVEILKWKWGKYGQLAVSFHILKPLKFVWTLPK